MMVKFLLMEVRMNNENNIKSVLPIAIIILIFIIIFYVIKNYDEKNKYNIDSDSKQTESKQNYKSNEYIPIMVDDEQMSRKYLNDFKNTLMTDLDNSYKLLDHDYYNDIFGSVSEYKKYLSSLDLTRMTELDKWATYDKNGYKYYDLYDKNGNRFIFKTKGVMQYEVLFEDYDINGKNGE